MRRPAPYTVEEARDWLGVSAHSRIATSVVRRLASTVISLATERDLLRAALAAKSIPVTPEDVSMHLPRPDEMPVLTLRKRTPAEAKAYRDGARLAVNLILGRLQGVVKHPADVTVPTADVRAACEYAHGLIQSADEIAAVTPEDAARGYGVEPDDDDEPGELCEGCRMPATCEDCMGIPLCDKCFEALPEVDDG